MKKTILRYHSTWIAAAEVGEITWETASMLIEAFDLGVCETEEILRNGVVHSPSIAEQAIEIKNDTFQYLENIGKPIKFPPARLQDNERCDEVVIEISETVNFKARNRNKQLKIEV
ncbi:conserved hypothetical protein [Vibrio crassostreae]|uniref:hypothetical protein n=1 Tax=Vibrio TaxID=662 RepID=UPI000C8559FE|nr:MULTISPECIES: hypothetical protein [Vibrio]PML54687.1 hypothetical protein BCT81_01225 [Vibrio sp. 10N.261.52.A1]TCU01346.1 hypothetical protein EDB47_11817 [Vibrio crassostreae]CAK2344004.1 conserved hypothetical protein [Vibrio crassostreae]CAK2817236.1 conserved hypothetical protein [Vibrio crassostreae]CAK2901539.1 conserved hypothetical protein [Vibrio crassostreae]